MYWHFYMLCVKANILKCICDYIYELHLKSNICSLQILNYITNGLILHVYIQLLHVTCRHSIHYTHIYLPFIQNIQIFVNFKSEKLFTVVGKNLIQVTLRIKLLQIENVDFKLTGLMGNIQSSLLLFNSNKTKL